MLEFVEEELVTWFGMLDKMDLGREGKMIQESLAYMSNTELKGRKYL